MKIFKLLIVLFLISVPAWADVERKVETVVDSGSASPIAVASTGTVYSKSFSLKNQNPVEKVGVMYKATSSGTVSLQIRAQQSYQVPTTEGSSDSAYMAWKDVDLGVSDQNWHMATLDTVIFPYGRFQITGTGSNDASTTVQIKLGKD